MRHPRATWRPLPFHDARPSSFDLVVVHYTATTRAESALRILARRRLSAHFLIGTRGRLFQMVPTRRRAWHAGVSAFQGREGVNAFSIGVEMVNPGPLRQAHGAWMAGSARWTGPVSQRDGEGWAGWPDRQIAALLDLLAWIGQVHPSVRGHVTGHGEIAPARKVDPGPAFPWHYLTEAGWPLTRA